MLTTKAEKGQTLNSVSWMTVEGWIGGAMAMLVIGLVYPISNYFLNLYINVLKSSNKAYWRAGISWVYPPNSLLGLPQPAASEGTKLTKLYHSHNDCM